MRKDDQAVSVSLSGGGYRAAAFGAGALLALADSTLRGQVTSVSSVSGGSLAAAVTIGGFVDPSAAPEDDAGDPMGRRVGLLAEITRSKAVFVEEFIGWASMLRVGSMLLVLVAFISPTVLSHFQEPVAVLLIGYVWFGLPMMVALSAVPASVTAVQAMIENVTSHVMPTVNPVHGAALRDIDPAEHDGVRRVFCSTDLLNGTPVYLSHDIVLGANRRGDQPNILLADAVAASAVFPGFRPLEFDSEELGWPDTTAATDSTLSPPRPRRVAPRFAGVLSVIGLLGGSSFVVARISGFLDGASGFVAASLGAGGFVLLAVRSARRLGSDRVGLVDGGIYDNLGAAFTALTGDKRYVGLNHMLGATSSEGDHDAVRSPSAFLVVDASKVLTPQNEDSRRRRQLQGGFGALIPLRLRALPHSMVLHVQAANSIARKHAIERFLQMSEMTVGAVASITDLPKSTADDTQDGINWASVALANAATKTTLDALPVERVAMLIFHGYRVTEQAICRLGATLKRRRSFRDIMHLIDKSDAGTLLDAGGPYSRKDARIRRASRAIVLMPGITYLAVAAYNLLVG